MKPSHPLYEFKDDYRPRPKALIPRPPNWFLVLAFILGISVWGFIFWIAYSAFRGGR